MILEEDSTEFIERDEIMKLFRKQLINYIVTTNEISRGIDVSDFSFVINFDPPYEKDIFGNYQS